MVSNNYKCTGFEYAEPDDMDCRVLKGVGVAKSKTMGKVLSGMPSVQKHMGTYGFESFREKYPKCTYLDLQCFWNYRNRTGFSF